MRAIRNEPLKSSAIVYLLSVIAVTTPVTVFAQGPSSRPTISGPTIERRVMRTDTEGRSYVATELVSTEIPIPDMFRMEAPFVERDLRLDYVFTNHLQEPPADESQFFGEISYSFNERFGIIFGTPYLIRDNFEETGTSGFGDIEVGARYVAIGYDEKAWFKLAYGFNVVAPTGDVDRELGEGVTFLEPEVLMLKKLADDTFAQAQFSLGIPTESGATTEFEYDFGVGHVCTKFSHSHCFAYPTPMVELNGFTGVGGAEAGTTVLEVTPGLRWLVGRKMFAGFAASVPVTGPREFETQFLFSLIYLYGAEKPTGEAGAPSSRAYF